MIQIVCFETDMQPIEVKFNYSAFWIRVYNLPILKILVMTLAAMSRWMSLTMVLGGVVSFEFVLKLTSLSHCWEPKLWRLWKGSCSGWNSDMSIYRYFAIGVEVLITVVMSVWRGGVAVEILMYQLISMALG